MTEESQRIAYSVREVAEMVNLSRTMIYNLVREGKIPARKFRMSGKKDKIIIPKNGLQGFLMKYGFDNLD